MDASYQRNFKFIQNFLETKKVLSEPKELLYINSSCKSLIHTANSISHDQNTDIEQITSLDIVKKYLHLSSDLSSAFASASINYFSYLTNRNLSKKEQNTLQKDTVANLSKYLSCIQEYASNCNALSHLLMQHNLKMGSLNLQQLKVTPEQLENEFDYKLNSHSNIVPLITKTAFWTNKIVKYIENIKVAILLFSGKDLTFKEENLQQFSDSDKINAIYKEQLLTKIHKEFSTKLPKNISFSAFLIIYDSIVNYDSYEKDENLQNALSKVKHLRPSIDDALLKDFSELDFEYNKTFSNNENPASIITDFYTVSNNFSLEETLYNYKDDLLLLLALTLHKQKNLASPYINHYGKSLDTSGNYVMSVDLPNFFMPASFHCGTDISTTPSLKKIIDSLPEYKSYFHSTKSTENIPTFLLFAPTTEQKKYIKEEFRKVKNHPDSKRAKILSQMNGMSNGRWQEFDGFISNEKEK